MSRITPSEYLKDQVMRFGLQKLIDLGIKADVSMDIVPAGMQDKGEYRRYRLYPGDEINVGDTLFKQGATLITVKLDYRYYLGIPGEPWLGNRKETLNLSIGDRLILRAGDPLIGVE